MRRLIPCLVLFLSGCISFSASLQPTNESVRPEVMGHECAYNVFGFGLGKITVEQAMKSNLHKATASRTSFRGGEVSTPIRKIHAVELEDTQMLLIGSRCVRVLGEP